MAKFDDWQYRKERIIYGDQARRKTDATGTKRRLQALIAIGYTNGQLSREIGAEWEGVVRKILGNPVVWKSTATKVRAAYDRLWDKPPVAENPFERGIITRQKRLAKRRGWPVPMDWDDETIDDPAARPFKSRRSGAHGSTAEEVAHLRWFGESDETIAKRLGIDVASIKTADQRAKVAA